MLPATYNTTTTLNHGLRLNGSAGYQISDGRILISLDGIASDRAQDNLSGTLRIELWALTQPYPGGDFSGIALAGTQIGELYGQHWLPDCRYDLLFNQPPSGEWHLCLMLREWDGGEFVTRDFINFDHTYQVEPVVMAGVDAEEEQPVSEVAPVVVSIDSRRRTVEQKEPAALKKAGKEKTTLAAVSVNHASEKELAAIKGVSRKLAATMVAGRPYESLDDLIRLKGFGKKSLEKVRSALML